MTQRTPETPEVERPKTDAEIAAMASHSRLLRQIDEQYEARKRRRRPPSADPQAVDAPRPRTPRTDATARAAKEGE